MSMKLGTTSLNAVYLGTTSIAALYLGAAQVFGGGVVEFSPASLFESGEVGAWYDPSDLSTLFQDTAGTTPVTTSGQTVGLMLDKSQGAGYADGSFTGLGSEENSNPGGPFTTTTGYTAYRSATLSIVSGALRVSGTTETFPYAGIPFSTVVGKTYYVEGLSTSVSGSNIDVYLQKNDAPSGAVNAVFFGPDEPAGIKSGVFVATATTTYILAISVQLDNVVDWSYISVKELPGFHATQPTAAARPTYQTDGNLHWLAFDGVDDRLTTGSVDMSATSMLTFFAGIRSLDTSGSLNGAFTTSSDTGNYRFVALAPSSSSVHFSAFLKGTVAAQANATAAEFAPPNTRVMTGISDLSAGVVTLRLDGNQIATASGTGTAGNFRNSPYTIGALVSAGSLAFEGNFYGVVARGAESTATEVSDTETYLAVKTGVTL